MTIAYPAHDIDYGDQRSALIVGDAGVALAAAAGAAGHADLRVTGSVALADVGAFLARAAAPDVIAVELADADPVAAAPALAAIETIARAGDVDVVVALTHDQIDWVAAQLFGGRTQLLCDPDVVDRVAALRLALGMRGHRLHDSASDADERLRRLNAEVARFAETLSHLAADRAQSRPAQVRSTQLAFRSEAMLDSPTAVDAGDVRDMIRSRRMRAAHFPEGMFADPAWDMLLDLFAAELEHRRVSVSSLCIAAAVPGTTALRWIGSMIEAQLFERYADPHDRRRAFISLSTTAQDGMERYFSAVRRAGLPPA